MNRMMKTHLQTLKSIEKQQLILLNEEYKNNPKSIILISTTKQSYQRSKTTYGFENQTKKKKNGSQGNKIYHIPHQGFSLRLILSDLYYCYGLALFLITISMCPIIKIKITSISIFSSKEIVIIT